ncbi:MAG: hypothetical protein WC069_06580 [Candidatus Shapirobacteria bacterium]
MRLIIKTAIIGEMCVLLFFFFGCTKTPSILDADRHGTKAEQTPVTCPLCGDETPCDDEGCDGTETGNSCGNKRQHKPHKPKHSDNGHHYGQFNHVCKNLNHNG